MASNGAKKVKHSFKDGTAVDQEALAYWKATLADVGFVQLPTDFPSLENQQFAESEETLELSDLVCRSLAKYNMNTDPPAKPFTVIMAAFVVLLHKFSREESIAIGSSNASFNPLVLRLDVTGEMTLKELVENTDKAEQNAAKHDIPFDSLMQLLYPTEEDRERMSSLFQVRVFNVVDVNTETLDASRCDWTLFVEQVADSKRLLPLRLRLVFNSAVTDRGRITDLLQQVQMVVEQITTAPETKIVDVNVLTDAMKPRFPDPAAVLDDTWHGAIHDKLSEQAAKQPDAPFIIDGDKSYTYKYIDGMSNRVANYLVSNGIQKEDRVALYAHRSTAIVIGIMGILKSGATFTVVDPAYPVKRQTVYLQVAKPRGVITLAAAGLLDKEVQSYIDSELDLACQLNGLDPDNLGPVAEQPATPCGVQVGPDNIGTLSFTSGSTGLPKAVRGRHISLTHFYPWMGEEFGMGKDDRFSMLSGIAHDPIQRDIFTPIFFGATIYIPSSEDIGNPGQLAEWVAKTGVSVVHLTPAMGQLLTANATANMPDLKVALFVGDVLTKRDIRRLQSLAHNVVAVNMYGTTETQRSVSFLKIPNDPSVMDKFKEILPSGVGMKDVQLLVLRDNMQSVGLGELGELYVRSFHLSAGYLGLPDATAAKFLQNPHSSNPADRFYKTGDLGRYLTSGIVECIGRADDQVKIRGFRIELGEIDTYLGQHPQVRENKTLVMRDAQEEKQIISFFVPLNEDYKIDEIRAYLQTKLPTYAVPSILCPIQKMPLTPNGKVDKNKLPYPDMAVIMAQRRADTSDKTEATPLQRQLMSIWEEVLGRPVFRTDNFFEVGGHSILATRVTFSMRTALNQDLPLNLLYQHPTIQKLSDAIESSRLDPSYVLGSSREKNDTVDLMAEVRMEESIASNGLKYTHNTTDPQIFLTGATGFLGAFLVGELMNKFPKSHITCLVRAMDDEKALERVVTNVKNHQVWQDSFGSRLTAVVGDLSLPLFGMDKDEFNKVAARTDIVIHNGAMVHWVYPYAKLKPMNVNGTIEALRLATSGGKLSALHFVSTTSVFDSPHYVQLTVPIPDDDDMSGGVGLTVGYGQSKWVAEKLVMLAQARGVPATIFRPGYITGHSQTGVMNVDDYLVRLLKGCLQLGKAPVMQNPINMCTVDYVASAIATVAADEGGLMKAYNISNPTTFRFSDYFSSLQNYGYPLNFVDYLEWRNSLMHLTLESKSNVLYPLLHFVLDDLPTRSNSPRLSNAALSAALANTEVKCAPIQDVMGIYLAYLVGCGYLEKPSADAKQALPTLQHASTMVKRSDRSMA